MKSLPTIMVAPNGARRSKQDHPALPITVSEVVATAVECKDAGAGGIHLHVRDSQGGHVLDTGLYLETLSELKRLLPGFYLQITTESVGLYTPQEQQDIVRSVRPEAVSIAIAEMLSTKDKMKAMDFYGWCNDAGIAVQHILYEVDDLKVLAELIDKKKLDPAELQLLFVLGKYAKNQESSPSDLNPYLDSLKLTGLEADWAICAFGKNETSCLVEAFRRGGKIRVGFENSLWNSDGSLAENNAERVAEIHRLVMKTS